MIDFSTQKKRLLAIGIPTFKRPDSAINAIKNAISLNIYDQIIVSSNSYETELIQFINLNNNITFYQQPFNVGVAENFKKIVQLCDCKYLHIVSDEDTTNKVNTILLYDFLKESKDYSVIICSILGNDNNIYKDASWQRNRFLMDLMGEISHIGSSIINIDIWNNNFYESLQSYCDKPGNLRVANALALISCSSGLEISYFSKHIVEMGKIHKEGEIRGSYIYGFTSLIEQYISIIELTFKLKLKNKIIILISTVYYFSSHAFQDSFRKFFQNGFLEFLSYVNRNKIFKLSTLLLFIAIIYYYYFRIYFLIRTTLSSFLRAIHILK